MRHIDPVYYSYEDVMRLLDYSKSTAYKKIRELNDELKAKGYHIRPGMIPKEYFHNRYAWAVGGSNERNQKIC